jgi:hypothetical protein
MIMRYDALCDRQYLRAHRRFLDIRRHSDNKIQEPSKPTAQPEQTPEPEAPAATDLPPGSAAEAFVPEPFVPEPFSPEPCNKEPFAPEQSAEPNKNQPNEPNNPLKTREPAAQNPTRPTETRRRGQARLAAGGYTRASVHPDPPARRPAAHRLQLQLRKRLRSPSAR